MSESWQTRAIKSVYENNWIEVSHRDVITPGGSEGIYGVVHFKNIAVGVLAIDADEKLVLVGQSRYPLQQFSWEIPEGGCKLPQHGQSESESESTIACAKRELAEETGLRASSWQPFLSLHLSNSITDERAEVFLARELSSLEAGHAYRKDETEADIQVKRVSLKEALAMIDRQEMTDAISVAAIYKFATSASSL